MASFFAELRALREDIKVLLDNQRESKRRAYGVSKDVNAIDVKLMHGVTETEFNGVTEMGSTSTEDALRDLRGEMASLKNTLYDELHQIANSFRACLEGSNPLPSTISSKSLNATPPSAKTNVENLPTFHELAQLAKKAKVRLPRSLHARPSV
jgi:hypothetical protein